MDLEGLVNYIRNAAGDDRNVVVALSGGVDSGLTAWAARTALGDRAVAATVISELTPERERFQAEKIASHIGIRLRRIEVSVLADPLVRANEKDRCYHCKRLIFRCLQQEFPGDVLFMDGTNKDDDPLRPGLRALKEFGVVSPLREVGLGKDVIRALARDRGLPNWNAPSESCLATRIPVGTALSGSSLKAVETIEDLCRELGMDTVRVYVDDMVAIVEHLPEYADIVERNRDNVVAAAKEIGMKSCRFREWRG